VDNYDTCASVFVVLFNGFVTHKLLWCYVQILTLQKPHIPASFKMYLLINKWVIAVKVSNFSGQYLRNHSTLDIGVFGYIVIVWPKEHSPEVRSFPPGTPYILFSEVQHQQKYSIRFERHKPNPRLNNLPLAKVKAMTVSSILTVTPNQLVS
jgi:hypothetical protein